jgi:hypothetical protein
MTTLKGKYTTAKFLLEYNFYKAQTLVKNLFIKEATKECNVCGWHGKSFYAFYNEMPRKKDPTLCPVCKSSVYQRALAQYLQDNITNPLKCYNILEIAPHSSDPVNKVLRTIDRIYRSIDIVKGRAMEVGDLRQLTYPDNTFDLIVASAVLEHIKEDSLALKEMHRTLKPSGVAIIQVPVGYYKEPLGLHTIEFKGQPFYEHFRAYGYDDFTAKASLYGFKVKSLDFTDKRLGFESPSLMGFFVCTKE